MRFLNKKTIIIISLIAIVGFGGYLLWKQLTGEEGTAPVAEKEAAKETPLEIEVGEVITGEKDREKGIEFRRLSDAGNSVFDFWISPETNSLFYITQEGHVYEAKPGPDISVSTQNISALNSIEVGPEGSNILVAFGDPKQPSWGLFDSKEGAWRPLPSEIINATWGADEKTLIAIIKSGGDATLGTLNLSKIKEGEKLTYKTLVRHLGLKDVSLKLLSENELIIAEGPLSSYESRIWKLNLENLDFSLFIGPERGLLASFSDGLVFKFSMPETFYIADENLRLALPSPFTTLPNKCAVSELAVWCFVPQNFPPELPNLEMPDDYLRKRFYTVDDLYKINRETAEISLVWASGSLNTPELDAKKILFSDNKIIFINRYDDALYEITIPSSI